jgi:hypothetical protein
MESMLKEQVGKTPEFAKFAKPKPSIFEPDGGTGEV